MKTKEKNNLKLKEKTMCKKVKNTSGITLIALVITIIVLLILAGITIVALTGENGILKQANKAKQEQEISAVKECWELIKQEIIISKNTGSKMITKEEMKKRLASAGLNQEELTTLFDNEGFLRKYNIQYSDLGLSNLKSYAGKKVSILGDSISTLKGYIPTGNRTRYVQTQGQAINGLIYITYEETWWGRVINSTNMELGVNESWAGSCVSNTITSNSGDEGPDRHMASMARLEHLDDNGTPDVILFYGGTNDIGKNKTMGEFDSTASYATTLDTTSTMYASFVEAYTIAIKRMQYLYPNAEIISILPTYTKTYYDEARLIAYNDKIKEICNYFNIKCVDLTKSGITTSQLVDDGIHPTSEGMELIANYVIDTITTIQNESGGENNGDSESSSSIRTTANTHAQALPNGITSETNLWTTLIPEQLYYSTEWSNEYPSITFAVKPGDKVVSNSIKASDVNGGGRNGIRVTFFNDDTVVKSLAPNEAYKEYATYGYLTVPAGANCVSVPMWKDNESSEVYLLID